MSNKFKDIDIKNHIYYFFDEIINIKKSIQKYFYLLHSICDNQIFEILKKINSANPLYLIINKVNRSFKEINKNKYLALPSWHAIPREYSLSVPSTLQCSGNPGNI